MLQLQLFSLFFYIVAVFSLILCFHPHYYLLINVKSRDHGIFFFVLNLCQKLLHSNFLRHQEFIIVVVYLNVLNFQFLNTRNLTSMIKKKKSSMKPQFIYLCTVSLHCFFNFILLILRQEKSHI